MDPFRPLDDAARAALSACLAAPHGALATLAADGAPRLSRVAVLWLPGTGATLLLSDLSDHARALAADPRASLLLGEPGPKGDPLAHPRLTLSGRAAPADKTALAPAWARARPKTRLYLDFADFRIWRLDPTEGLLNAGFGRAHRVAPADLASLTDLTILSPPAAPT